MLAEGARSECAPSMRAVVGDHAALAGKEWKEEAKKVLATGKARVLARAGRAGG